MRGLSVGWWRLNAPFTFVERRTRWKDLESPLQRCAEDVPDAVRPDPHIADAEVLMVPLLGMSLCLGLASRLGGGRIRYKRHRSHQKFVREVTNRKKKATAAFAVFSALVNPGEQHPPHRRCGPAWLVFKFLVTFVCRCCC